VKSVEEVKDEEQLRMIQKVIKLQNELDVTVKPHKILRRKNEEQKITFCEKFCREMPNGNRNTEMKKIIR